MQTKVLRSGHIVKVDDRDAGWLDCAIRVLRNRRDGRSEKHYAMIGTGQLLHRLILDAPSHMLVDHIDGDGMNNQRDNLRLASRSQNACNRGKQRDNTSGFKGVYQYGRRSGKWVAKVKLHQKEHILGVFDSIEEAAIAAAEGRKRLHGDFAAD